ncbi:hypothetical protein RHSIM_Rhsim06G0221200 [Rhododendron simsii]|uniref:Uncharacterized protein n=1 Tax=Rhododendron simsii TaxID=118357 RepID=A0A834LLY6_RHOSS|nr:hypothetical protein RHSIM_Rhsim06G0221200 [Rhododendron simsii]
MAEELEPFHIEKDEKTLYLNPYAWNQGHLCSTAKPSQAISRYNSAGNEKNNKLEGIHARMISDESYKQLNLLCNSQSFIHPSGQFDKARDMASEELGEIDPYSILTPPCTAASSLSSQQKKRWRITYCGSWKILMMGRCNKVEGENEAVGVKKVPGCSSIEVDGHVHEFLVGDASHRKMKEVHAMLDVVTKPLSGLEDIEMEAENKVAGIL